MLRLVLLVALGASGCARSGGSALPPPASAPAAAAPAPERLWVVEREKESVAVLEGGKRIAEISGLGNLNHATLKFRAGAAYVISRDGYLSKVDTRTLERVRQARVGESGIGMEFVRAGTRELVAVANYAPPEVVVLDLDLNEVRRIPTGSRNVGIKSAGSLLIFSLMDRNEVWVLDAARDFAVVKKIEQGGQMPFDALLAGGAYLVGFFNDPSLGHLDLATLEYTRHRLSEDGREVTLKVPHFGTWGVSGASRERVFVPAVGARQLHLLDLTRFAYLGKVELSGTPVFAVVSPDGRRLVVNFSGDRENFLAVIDPATGKVLRELDAGRRVMHVRFSADSRALHVSSYFDHAVKTYETAGWTLTGRAEVPSPSGIFLQTAEAARP